MQLLEMDLKAAISKGQHEEVLDSIRMLGNMRSVSSVEEIAAIMPAEDDNLAAEIYLALLQLGDYRYLGETVSFLQRAVMTNRQRWIQSRIGAVLAEVQTSSAFDDIVRLVSSPNVGLRLSAVRAIRNMRTERSIPFLIARLSDQEWLIRYTAMAALAEATNKTEGWVPPLLDFRQQEAPFIAKWQSWWAAEGMHLHKAQQSTGEEPRAVAAPRRRE
jgi:HEAT repeat protein